MGNAVCSDWAEITTFLGSPIYQWAGCLYLRAGIRLRAVSLTSGAQAPLTLLFCLVAPPENPGGQLCSVEPMANSWERRQEAFLWAQA